MRPLRRVDEHEQGTDAGGEEALVDAVVVGPVEPPGYGLDVRPDDREAGDLGAGVARVGNQLAEPFVVTALGPLEFGGRRVNAAQRRLPSAGVALVDIGQRRLARVQLAFGVRRLGQALCVALVEAEQGVCATAWRWPGIRTRAAAMTRGRR
jgi:hypothetical protein